MIEVAVTHDQRALLVSYLASKIGTSPQSLVGHMPFQVTAVMRDGNLVGAVMYINYRGTSIEMACAGEPGWLTKGNLRDLFQYPFDQLKVHTVLTMVSRSNRDARAFNTKLGFTELCVIPSGDRARDTILYAMTRDQCPWIETGAQSAVENTATGASNNGQRRPEAA